MISATPKFNKISLPIGSNDLKALATAWLVDKLSIAVKTLLKSGSTALELFIMSAFTLFNVLPIANSFSERKVASVGFV